MMCSQIDKRLLIILRRSLPVVFDGAHQADLDQGDGCQGQRVANNAPWDGEVVKGAAVQHLCAGLEPGAAMQVGAIGLPEANVKY